MNAAPLKGKNALVTGSTSGIGLGVARVLASQGASILLNGLGDKEEISVLRKSIAEEFGVVTAYHDADMSNPGDIEALMRFADERLGGIDILVNNAGIQHVASIEDFPVEKWDAIIAINLTSAFHTTRFVLPSMKKNNWGRIVNIASVNGLVGVENKSAYVAAKHGLVGFTKATALEMAKTRITCNAICPGWVLTPLAKAQIEARAAQEGTSVDEMKEIMLAEKIPSREFVTAEQIGKIVAFLCSDAADEIRGALLPVDGGCVAQ